MSFMGLIVHTFPGVKPAKERFFYFVPPRKIPKNLGNRACGSLRKLQLLFGPSKTSGFKRELLAVVIKSVRVCPTSSVLLVREFPLD